MKHPFIWALTLVTLCAAFTLTAPKSRAATITADNTEDLQKVLERASDGDIIQLGDCYVNEGLSGQDLPWVIDKAVTFQGGSIYLRGGGIILNADVTFRDTELTFTSFVRHGIMANGYTLTLDGVTCASGGRPIHLFCGGSYTETEDGCGSTPGSGGKIVIRGRTSLASTEGVGNIYAGNLCLGGMTEENSAVHGPANTFDGNPEIVIEAEQGSELGRIYAGGAEEKIPQGQMNGKVFLTNPDSYKVSGSVSVRLHASTVDYVNGLGAAETHVTYTDTRASQYVTDGLGVYHVSSLTAESGYVSPKADSSFADGAALAVKPGAKLSLEQLGSVTAGRFDGGGKLCLGQRQTLRVTGAVTGSTSVAIGGFNAEDGSFRQPAQGHVYISASPSLAQETSFTLAPPTGQPDLAFTYDGASGEWFCGESPETPPVVARSLRFERERILLDSGQNYAEMPLVAELMDDTSYVDFLPVEISVNGVPAVLEDGENSEDAYPRCTVNGVLLEVYVGGDCLNIGTADISQTIPDGEYRVKLTVPGTNTASGDPITASATLVVGGIRGEISGIDIVGGALRVRLTAPGAGTVMAAVYDQSGRLVRFGSVEIPAGGAEYVDIPLSTSGGTTAKAFLTDGTRPLCRSGSLLIP